MSLFSSDVRLRLGAVFLAGVFFAIDLLTRRGIAAVVLYVAVVLLCSWLPRERETWVAAAGCSLLVIFGYAFSRPDLSVGVELVNRAAALVAIWITASLVVHRQSQEKRFRVAVEGAPNAILMMEAGGDIALANAEAEKLFGYEPGELVGKNVDMLVPERFRAKHPDFRARFAEEPRARPMGAGRDLHGLRKDGNEIPVEIGLNPIRTEKGLVVLSTIIDISERKRAEEAVVARNKELQTLLYVISHDLKEPLRSIGNFSQLVQERYHERLDEKGRDFLDRVVKASARMHSLLSDILVLSRARHAEPPATSVDAGPIVDEALRSLRPAIERSRASVRVARNLPTIRADRVWVTAVAYNLISNALKFVRDGESPEIEVDAYWEPSGELGTGLIVRDRGPGVAPEHAERIFELFQRAVGREVQGTGAGLAIVRAVAERHGGRAWVRPREGGGSEFVVTFG